MCIPGDGMDPEYRAYLNHIIHHLELEQSELDNLDPDYVVVEEEDDDDEEEDEGEETDEQEETDEEEDEEEEEEEEEDEDERDGDNAGGVDVGWNFETASRLLDNHLNAVNSHMAEVINVDDSPAEDANEVEVEVECGCSTERANIDDSKRGTAASLKGSGEENEDFNGGEIDGLFCPICFEAWSSGGGDHHVWYALCFIYPNCICKKIIA